LPFMNWNRLSSPFLKLARTLEKEASMALEARAGASILEEGWVQDNPWSYI